MVGVIAYMFLPLIVGGLADLYGYSNEQLGFIGAAEAGGMGIANGLAVFWMRRSNWRIIIMVSALGMITANLLSMFIANFELMFLVRLLDGLAGGTLIGGLLFFMSQGGLWTFIERIAAASDLDPQWIGTVLSFSSLCGIAGALGAKRTADIAGQLNVFLFVLAGEMVCVFLLSVEVGPAQYLIAVGLFIFFWSMGLPLLLPQFNDIDGSGHLVVLLYAMSKLGYTLGPAVVGMNGRGRQLFYVLIFGAAICVAGLGISIALALFARRSERPSAT